MPAGSRRLLCLYIFLYILYCTLCWNTPEIEYIKKYSASKQRHATEVHCNLFSTWSFLLWTRERGKIRGWGCLGFYKKFWFCLPQYPLDKMSSMQLDTYITQWANGCLKDQAQRVVGNGEASGWKSVIVFINDLDTGVGHTLSRFPNSA